MTVFVRLGEPFPANSPAVLALVRCGSDGMLDGRLFFHDEPQGGKTKQIILSVKSGHVSVPFIPDLRGANRA